MTDTTALVEELARAIAQSHGFDFDEVCGCDADPDNGYCDSSTCIAAGYEDHDPEYARACYRNSATATLPIIAREVEKARAEVSVNQCEMPEVAAMRYIESLRSDYGTVTILPDNDEANTKAEQMAIDCCGEWTNWQDQRFYGESVIQCLAKAVGVRAKSVAIRATEVTK